jgi:hypothetical protein
MATEAARLERKESTGRRKKKHLTHTGLLMEGIEAFALEALRLLTAIT